MNEKLANLKIGSSKKKVVIVDVDSQLYAPTDKDERVYIKVATENGKEYKVCEIWVRDHNQEIVHKGLWLNLDDSKEKLDPTSPLVRLLQFLGATSLSDIIGKTVTVEPKSNGFMAIIAYEE